MKEKKQRRTMDIVLMIIAVTTLLFIAGNFYTFLKVGAEQTTLITCYFAAIVGELLVGGVMQTFKIKSKNSKDDSDEGGV
jgi:hypothetical protein